MYRLQRREGIFMSWKQFWVGGPVALISCQHPRPTKITAIAAEIIVTSAEMALHLNMQLKVCYHVSPICIDCDCLLVKRTAESFFCSGGEVGD